MMSGSDLSSFAYIRPAWRPREYTTRLAKLLNCPTHHSYDMVQCLRDSNKHKWQEFVETQDFILPHVSEAAFMKVLPIGFFTQFNIVRVMASFTVKFDPVNM